MTIRENKYALNSRIKQIDILNGIGIIFVVLGHYSTYMEYSSWSTWIWSWHMPLFFLSGGYLFALNENRYFKKGYLEYIKKQFINTLIPYIVFYFISFFIMYIVMPILKGTSITLTFLELKKLLIAFVLSGGYLETVKINNFSLWFLPLYFLSKIAFFLVVKIQKYSKVIYMIFIIFITLVTIPIQQAIPGRPAYHINVLPVAIIFMAIGKLFYEIKGSSLINIRITEYTNEIVSCIFIYIGIVIAYRYPGNVGNIGNLLYIVGACCTVLGLYIFAGYNKGVILAFLGENSVIILGLHSLVGGFFRNFIEGHLLVKWDGPMVNFILVSLQLAMLSIICVCWKKVKK